MNTTQILQGNIALCEAALRAGCSFYAGYPITPQTSITEYLSYKMEEHGRDFVQAESEIAAINMVAGASAGGARAMTATSGPGFSLMAEGLSFIASSKFPAVVVNVGRGGPGGGNIKPSQSDYNYATKTLGHGGFRAFTIAPKSVQEIADWTYRAFDIAEKYNCLVIILMDGMLGQMMEPVQLPEPLANIPKRENIVCGKEGRERRVLKDFETVPEKFELITKERAALYEFWEKECAVADDYCMDDAEYVIAAWGSAARIAITAIDMLREEGIPIGLIRPVTLHPFPVHRFQALDSNKIRKVMSIEMSDPRQFYYDVNFSLENRIPLTYYTRSGGMVLSPDEICAAVKERML